MKTLLGVLAAVFISATLQAQNIYDTNQKLELVKVISAENESWEIKPGSFAQNNNRFYCGVEGGWERLVYFDLNLKKGRTSPEDKLPEAPGWDKVTSEAYQPAVSGDEKTIVFVAGVGAGRWEDNDLYISEMSQDGTYETPKKLGAISEDEVADAYPSLSQDGLTLYFVRDNKPMVSIRENRSKIFTTAVPLSIKEATDLEFRSLWVDNKGLHIYFVTDDQVIYHASRKDLSKSFGSPEVFTAELQGLDFISGISLDQKQQNLFLYSSQGNYEEEENRILWYRVK